MWKKCLINIGVRIHLLEFWSVLLGFVCNETLVLLDTVGDNTVERILE